MEKFCDNQHKCEEDTEDTYSCIGYLGDGRCFQCPYLVEEDRNKAEYPCQNYKPI